MDNAIFRVAPSKLRASSNDLETARGRYVRPKLYVVQKSYLSHNVDDDKEQFVTACEDAKWG